VLTAASSSVFSAPATAERTRLLAVHAATALLAAQRQENLWQAVDARKLIGQAQGMLMERFTLDTDQAFAVLLRYSQDRNLKLRTVAEQLIEERRLPD
jgi:AmiR/NasT family two-component response regulator